MNLFSNYLVNCLKGLYNRGGPIMLTAFYETILTHAGSRRNMGEAVLTYEEIGSLVAQGADRMVEETLLRLDMENEANEPS